VPRLKGSHNATIPAKFARTRIKSLSDFDLRAPYGRRAIKLRNGLISDLGGDPTNAQREIAQRAAVLSVMLESYEARWLAGEEINETLYTTLANCQRKSLDVLGYERKARDITPTLTEYLKTADGPMGLDTQEAPFGRPESS
jgi:hypothetical protein